MNDKPQKYQTGILTPGIHRIRFQTPIQPDEQPYLITSRTGVVLIDIQHDTATIDNKTPFTVPYALVLVPHKWLALGNTLHSLGNTFKQLKHAVSTLTNK